MTFVITMSLVDGAWGLKLKAEVRLLIQFCVFVSENSDGSATHNEGPSVRPEPYAASSPATELYTPSTSPAFFPSLQTIRRLTRAGCQPAVETREAATMTECRGPAVKTPAGFPTPPASLTERYAHVLTG